ncbi:MAG: 50S ribosomal protein L5 [Fibrobacterota bacterium]
MARIAEQYKTKVKETLKGKHAIKNVMLIPKLEKIVVNMGVGAATQDANLLKTAVEDLTAITGQKPKITSARKSVSNFKLREGQPIGCKVTLRGNMMWEFFDRLVNVALPRVRDFKGISRKSFDGRGNYSMGIKEHTIFSEINVDKVNNMLGMDITFVTSTEDDGLALSLLQELGVPFRKS